MNSKDESAPGAHIAAEKDSLGASLFNSVVAGLCVSLNERRADGRGKCEGKLNYLRLTRDGANSHLACSLGHNSCWLRSRERVTL